MKEEKIKKEEVLKIIDERVIRLCWEHFNKKSIPYREYKNKFLSHIANFVIKEKELTRKELIEEIEKRVLVSPKVKIENDDTLGYFKVNEWKNLKIW
jgi:hypothetical protein